MQSWSFAGNCVPKPELWNEDANSLFPSCLLFKSIVPPRSKAPALERNCMKSSGFGTKIKLCLTYTSRNRTPSYVKAENG